MLDKEDRNLAFSLAVDADLVVGMSFPNEHHRSAFRDGSASNHRHKMVKRRDVCTHEYY